jgi:hypothetical protein
MAKFNELSEKIYEMSILIGLKFDNLMKYGHIS